MTPRRTTAMVGCWVAAPAIIAAAIAIPAAITAHTLTMQAIGRAAGSGIPASIISVYRPGELAPLAVSGLIIAAAGALAPAAWAAGTTTVTALHAE
jgi:putative ABC transport system permease protein